LSFALSKILWAVVAPGSLLALLLGIGLLLMSFAKPARAKFGKRLCFFVFLCLAALAILPVGDWALTPLENRLAFDPPEHVDGIIVLGGDEKTEITAARSYPVALDSMRRYATFGDMAKRYPDAKLVYSGGSGLLNPDKTLREAEVASLIMAQIGIPVDHVMFEKESRNTFENAVYSMGIVKPEKTENWLLVTSAWHMPRAVGCFRKAGWNIYPVPTGYFTAGDYRFSFLFRFDEQIRALSYAMREYIGLAAYWLMGRTNALWPE